MYLYNTATAATSFSICSCCCYLLVSVSCFLCHDGLWMLTHMEDGNIYLSVLVDENLGDEDGLSFKLLLLASIPPYAIEADTQRNEHNNNRPQNSG